MARIRAGKYVRVDPAAGWLCNGMYHEQHAARCREPAPGVLRQGRIVGRAESMAAARLTPSIETYRELSP
jgi:hypothetical protein